MSSLDLCYLSATEALARFRDRSLSPVELMSALIARAEAVEPQIHAFAHTHYARALDAARQAEARYAPGAALPPRPLEGLALGVKDIHQLAGEIATHGSTLLRDNRDEATQVSVQRLLDAGAIPLARTTTPEFGSGSATWSPVWGTTHNPWNLAYNAGGSSGGAGAALAAGTLTLADGSDYGGSIRIPASCCGVVGYKPPHGRNPGDPAGSLDLCSHFGPMGRSVADVAWMQNVMSGPDPRDLASLPDRVLIPERLEGVAGWRVACSLDLGLFRLDPAVRQNTLAALAAFEALGCTVTMVHVGWTERCRDAYEAHRDATDAVGLSLLCRACPDALTPTIRRGVARGLQVTAPQLIEVQQIRAEMYQTLGPILAEHDLFVCPTTATPAVPADRELDDPVLVDGQPVPGHLGWVLTWPFNLLSALPVLSVPSGRDPRTGVPTGVQLIARPHDDLRVFRAGAALEAALGGPWYRRAADRPAL